MGTLLDALMVGVCVDLFTELELVPMQTSLPVSLAVLVLGLFIIAFGQLVYMRAALCCGPRDSLLVALGRRMRRVPIGAVSIVLLTLVTAIGYLLGGPVGIGTLICAFCAGPIMQLAFTTVHFNATTIRHQPLGESIGILLGQQKHPAKLR